MNLQDVMQSKRPFKRKSWNNFVTIDKGHFRWVDTKSTTNLSYEDIIAEDWLIQVEYFCFEEAMRRMRNGKLVRCNRVGCESLTYKIQNNMVCMSEDLRWFEANPSGSMLIADWYEVLNS